MDKLAKDLAEDKEYLKHCLERTQELNGLVISFRWWQSDERVLSVARILYRWTQFSETSEVIDFFEAPYNFEDKIRFIIEEIR